MIKSPFELDRILGLEYFVADTRGIGGRLRIKVEDFLVEEIFNLVQEEPAGEYTHFTLEKKNWETHRAIKTIARALAVSHKRFGYAGTKDRRALTRQRVAVWKIEPEQLEKLNIKDISLSDFLKTSQRISLGDSLGNNFRITIRNIDFEQNELDGLLAEAISQLAQRGVPNYFGYQRFGTTRPNTHLVGRALLRGDLEGAVIAYLGNPYMTEKIEAYEARKFLEATRDYRKALEVFPKYLTYERAMLDHLAKHPNDYAGALRRLPKKLRWMLLHAYQGYLFNKILSGLIGSGIEIRGRKIPLFGYNSTTSEGEQGKIERSVLEEESVTLESFKTKSMPELASEGLFRDASIETKISFEISDDELNAGKRRCTLAFALPKGSYATVVLREFMKTEPLNY